MSANTGFYREAWLVVAQGGWWKREDVLAAMPVGIESDHPYALFHWMVRKGHLERRGPRGHPLYGVTPACITPYGVPVGAVRWALIGGDAP